MSQKRIPRERMTCQNRGGGRGGVEKHCILLISLILILSNNIPLNASVNILLNYLTFINRPIAKGILLNA